MIKTLFVLILSAASLLPSTSHVAKAQTPDKTAAPAAKFRVYDSAGNVVSMEKLLAAVGGADVVCVGETHDDAGAHLFEAEFLRSVFARSAQDAEKGGRHVAVSLEMFERDVQTVLDEYLAGLISERHFVASSRPWKNYQTDYRPLVEFAREHRLAVVAANAPARYVSRVSQNGPASLSALSKDAREWLPPLPVAPASAAYAAKFDAFMSGEGSPHTAAPPPPAQTPNPHAPQGSPAGPVYLLDAQNLRDASMAHAISERLKKDSHALVLHYNGKFHSEERMGVPEQLAHYRKKARVLVVTLMPGDAFDAASMAKLGDFVVMTGAAEKQ